MKNLLKYRKLFIKVSIITLLSTAMAQEADSLNCGPGEVIICHNPSTNPVSLCVPPAAVAPHLGHGDHLGECQWRQVDVDASKDQEAHLGETVYYTFTVENQGNVTDTYRLTLTSEHGFRTGAIPEQVSLDPWKDVDISTSVELPLSGDFTSDLLTLSAVSIADDNVKDSESVTTYIALPEPDIAFTKTADKHVLVPGEQVIYAFSYENTGNIPLLSLVIEDRLPEQLRFEASSLPVNMIDEKTVKIEVDQVLFQGERGVFTITARVKEDVEPRGQIVNTAVLSAQGLPEDAVAQATSSIEVPDLMIEKTSSRSEVTVGDILLYTITVTNNGSGTALSVKLVDTLPSVMRYIPGTSVINGEIVNDLEGQNSQQLVWELGDIRGGELISLRYQTTVIAGTKAGDYTNTATIQAYNTGGQFLNVGPVRVDVRVGRKERRFPAEIEGIVYIDENGNGFHDPGEPGLPNVEVISIRDLLPQTSDEQGAFVFKDLDPGRQAIGLDECSLPEGYHLTTASIVSLSPGEGDRGFVEFGVQPILITQAPAAPTPPPAIELTPAPITMPEEIDPDERGDIPTPLPPEVYTKLCGRVFLDQNGNRQYDENEPLLPVFQVTLDNTLRTRGTAGKFIFSHLKPGTHVVVIHYENDTYQWELTLTEGRNRRDFPVEISRGLSISIEKEVLP